MGMRMKITMHEEENGDEDEDGWGQTKMRMDGDRRR